MDFLKLNDPAVKKIADALIAVTDGKTAADLAWDNGLSDSQSADIIKLRDDIIKFRQF